MLPIWSAILPTLSVTLPIWSRAFLALNFIEDSPAADFNDLGKLILGGSALAITLAVVFTFLRLRWRKKRPPTPQFISIKSFPGKKNG